MSAPASLLPSQEHRRGMSGTRVPGTSKGESGTCKWRVGNLQEAGTRRGRGGCVGRVGPVGCVGGLGFDRLMD